MPPAQWYWKAKGCVGSKVRLKCRGSALRPASAARIAALVSFSLTDCRRVGIAVVESGPVDNGCEIMFLAEDGAVRIVPLSRDTASTRLECVAPVRLFPSYRGQRNFPGLWWSATSGRHVGFESWLERDHAMLLDFDPMVVAFAAQPFRLSWRDNARRRSHVPDFFARLGDGTGVVIDCRPVDRVSARDAETFGFTERACSGVGWQYRLLGAPGVVLAANVRWLAGYRHPRHHRPEVVDRLLAAFLGSAPLLAGAESVGDPILVLPVLYHLLWRGVLNVELAAALNEESVVSPAGL